MPDKKISALDDAGVVNMTADLIPIVQAGLNAKITPEALLQQIFTLLLTGFTAGTNSSVTATDNIFSALRNLQAQMNARATTAALNAAVVGLYDQRGGYDPTGTGDFPTTGGSGSAGAIVKSDVYRMTADGTMNTVDVKEGWHIAALVDTPGSDPANWEVWKGDIAASTFISLLDTFSDYTGLGLKALRVNVAEDGIETYDVSATVTALILSYLTGLPSYSAGSIQLLQNNMGTIEWVLAS